jgi:hypothetical protein
MREVALIADWGAQLAPCLFPANWHSEKKASFSTTHIFLVVRPLVFQATFIPVLHNTEPRKLFP